MIDFTDVWHGLEKAFGVEFVMCLEETGSEVGHNPKSLDTPAVVQDVGTKTIFEIVRNTVSEEKVVGWFVDRFPDHDVVTDESAPHIMGTNMIIVKFCETDS